jgi:hypothetical protein
MRKILFLIILLAVIFGCTFYILKDSKKEKSVTGEKYSKVERKKESRHTDFAGAAEYEFNLLKNPLTGTIPEGVRAQELAQARQIAESQMTSRTALLNSYVFQGPNNLGGRTRALKYDVRWNGTTNRIILAGGVSGGIYKSTDNGATWVRKSPTGEHYSVTCLAQDTRAGFQDTWYYGVGEASGNSAGASGAFYSGNGVYKSTDNGETWARLAGSNGTALETFSTAADFVNNIIVDPTDGNVYMACPSAIIRSTNGGTTWGTVLSGVLASSSQYTDIAVSSTGRLYASFGGTNSASVDGVWASPPGPTSGDAGTWTQIAGAGAGGSPTGWNTEGTYGRVVLAIAPSLESRLYALYWNGLSYTCGAPAPEAELYYWDDVGGTWTDISATLPDEGGCLQGNDPFACQAGYDLIVAVKPDDASTIFIGGTNIYRSTNTGGTWTRIGGYVSSASYGLYASSHPDIHSIAFQPGSPSIMLCGNDGGIQRTTDNLAGTVAWTQINTGYRTYQYYHVTIDPRVGNAKVFGGAQDNGSTRNIGGTGSDFEMMLGGDGVAVGLSAPIAGATYEYCGFQRGVIVRRDATLPPDFGTLITPTGEGGTLGELFVTYFKLDVDNTEILYYVNDNVLYRTTSASTVIPTTWTTMTGVGPLVGAANDITSIATTRGAYASGTASLFLGTSNGRVFRLDNPALVASPTSPVDITGASFPAAANVSSIAVNPRNDDTVLVTFSNYGVTSVWWTGNANSATPTWTSVEGSLTLPSYRSSAIIINGSTVEYYVGTSVGIWGTSGLPGAISWAQEGSTSIGNAVVTSMALRPVDNNLLIGTHGYGMWLTSLPIIVPVTLVDFKGQLKGNNVLLEWTTASEQNSKHFEIEKSFNGINYRRIATIPAAGNSNSLRNYSYLDREPAVEFNYYRLRTFDQDGKNKESNVVLLKKPNVQQGIYVLSNPFMDNISIRFIKIPSGAVQMRLIDMSGRLVAKAEHSQVTQQQLTLDLSRLTVSKGTYILQVTADGTVFTSKLVKQ